MIAGAIPIDAFSADLLIDLFAAQAPDEDTFLTSPAYFQHTGRQGLWLLGDPARYLIYCRHPNRCDAVLIFPQPSRLDVELWEDAAQGLARLSASVTLARVHSRYRISMQHSRFERHDEEILDWRYPCTVLDNNALVEHGGKDFERFRQKLRRFADADVQRITVTRAADSAFGVQTRALIERWAALVAKQRCFSVDELRAPNLSAYDRALRGENPRFNAAIVVVDGRVVAFFTTEQPLIGDTVNGITMCIDREFGGSAELGHCEMAALHREQGFAFTNINGAETATLDQFRKKLVPASRYEVDSYHLVDTDP